MIFTKKSFSELDKMPLHRLKEYREAENKRYARAVPWCCDFHCDEEWESKEQEQEFKEWEKYINFINAMYKSRR